MSYNKVTLVGRLGKDPEMKYTQGGTGYCKFSIATDESWKDKDGEKQSVTTWHDIIVWSKLAEVCEKYLQKGKQVLIEGKIQKRSWDDKESGKKMWAVEIVASNMVMLGSKSDESKPKEASAKSSTRESGDDDLAF